MPTQVNTEHSTLLQVGTTIPSIDEPEAIAAWPAKKAGEFVAKIGMFSGKKGQEYKYFGASNPDYGGKGLIVIIKKKPIPGEQLKITKVLPTIAFADVVTPE